MAFDVSCELKGASRTCTSAFCVGRGSGAVSSFIELDFAIIFFDVLADVDGASGREAMVASGCVANVCRIGINAKVIRTALSHLPKMERREHEPEQRG